MKESFHIRNSGPTGPNRVDPRQLPRGAEDDFFCIRFGVWYPSFDCAVRTRYDTCDGCLNCDQGRFNEHRHARALALQRLHVPVTAAEAAVEDNEDRDASGSTRDP